MALAELRPAADSAGGVQPPATLAFAPLPRTRPDATMLAASLRGEGPEGSPLAVGADDAIAALTALAPAEQDAPAAEQAPDSPVQLAFAAAGDAAPTSEADRAIIAAFAASAGVPETPPTTVVASREPSLQEQASAIGVIFAAADLVSTANAAASPLPEAAVERAPAYEGDREEMLELIATPAATDDTGAELAMPVPGEANLYAAPDAATATEGLNGEPELPVDHFTTAEAEETGSSGFFAKLFSGLVN